MGKFTIETFLWSWFLMVTTKVMKLKLKKEEKSIDSWLSGEMKTL